MSSETDHFVLVVNPSQTYPEEFIKLARANCGSSIDDEVILYCVSVPRRTVCAIAIYCSFHTWYVKSME